MLRCERVDVTLAYLKGKDAESEEAQEHANSSSLPSTLEDLRTSPREISVSTEISPGLPVIREELSFCA
jgi:hypothetical protein